MNTQEAIKFVGSLRTNRMDLVGYELSEHQMRARNDKLNEVTYMLAEGKLYRKMWNYFKSTYGYRTTYNTSGDQQLSRLEVIIDKTEVMYLGSRPKSRKEKINDIMTRIRDLGVVAVSKNNVIDMLTELRDEEENV